MVVWLVRFGFGLGIGLGIGSGLGLGILLGTLVRVMHDASRDLHGVW